MIVRTYQLLPLILLNRVRREVLQQQRPLLRQMSLALVIFGLAPIGLSAQRREFKRARVP